MKTKILDGYSVTTSSGPGLLETAGRATIGGALGGPIGALIGGSTGRRTYREYRRTTFKVWYGDGKTKIKTVPNGNPDWVKYMEKLRISGVMRKKISYCTDVDISFVPGVSGLRGEILFQHSAGRNLDSVFEKMEIRRGRSKLLKLPRERYWAFAI